MFVPHRLSGGAHQPKEDEADSDNETNGNCSPNTRASAMGVMASAAKIYARDRGVKLRIQTQNTARAP